MALDNLQNHVHQTLAKIHESHSQSAHCLWLVALSGGCDSRVLLELCKRFAFEHGVTLMTAHINHQLRASAERDATFCTELARRSPHITQHITRDLDITPTGQGTQDAARHARWRALVEIATTHHASAILTGHHLDDALETLLMNAARGTGARGLSSLFTHTAQVPVQGSSIPCHRPLFDVPRAMIEDFANTERLTWVEDPTNATDAYTRNRIRHHALPHLTAIQGGHSGWRRTLSILREETDFIAQQVDALWRVSVVENWPWEGALRIDKAMTREAHPLLFKRLMLRAHAHIAPNSQAPSPAQLDAIKALRDTPGHVVFSGARVESESGAFILLRAPRRGGRGWFDDPAAPVMVEFARANSGEVEWAGRVWRWQKVSGQHVSPTHSEARCFRVDVSTRPEFELRGPRPGERFEGKKVKDILRQLGVPTWRRHLWPCLVKNDEIVALAGYCSRPDTTEHRVVFEPVTVIHEK